jgi:hypothetical protein
MPELCRFFGIVIRTSYDDHELPHFHAVYGDDEASVDIETLDVIDGSLPRRAHALVLEWAAAHRHELRAAWRRASDGQHPGDIDPLESQRPCSVFESGGPAEDGGMLPVETPTADFCRTDARVHVAGARHRA